MQQKTFISVRVLDTGVNGMHKQKGFTIIELLIVIILVGMVLSVALPVSYGMYTAYKASLRAQEVMAYVSELRRDAFLYSERKVLSSKDGNITVNGEKKIFKEINKNIAEPIVFFRNGTSCGGVIVLGVGDVFQNLVIKTPLGDLSLERSGT
jgi:prepilin-type N-terminal cleavage/methylation domain-containing protein